MDVVRLRPGRDKALRNRHPWIFSGAIQRPRVDIPPGEVVDVCDHAGQFLARGYYNPQSQIVIRGLTWERHEAIDVDFWRRRLRAAVARRQRLLDKEETTACRLVFAESDGLPGLIVDRYGDWLVLQSLTLGIERWKETLVGLLVELCAPRGIYERSDVDVRRHEGLAQVTGSLCGEMPPDRVEIFEHGKRFWVDLLGGHKTGFYLDQRENRRQVAPYCAGAEVLNVFSYTGAFAIYAAAAGARQVTNLDSSAEALAWAEGHMALNGHADLPATYLQGDAFQVLRQLVDEGRHYDVVILDPPKFAFSRAQLTAATRGYKDINMLAMRLLRPGGWLCSFSCSGLVSADLFQKVLFGASVDVGREARIVTWLSQSDDHPVLLTFPEGAYLKGLICRIE
ncbi:MAG: class I SAM-dependent rRNA methyltransferase [Anaerolineae bacterium]|nr:class I SAM-dependent rRNA methyltransferase [Anaerolineae bacterium]